MSTSRTTVVGSSIGVCSALPWKIVFLEPSLIRSKDSDLLRQGPLSRASLIARPSRQESTNVYVRQQGTTEHQSGSQILVADVGRGQPRIRCEALSCPL